MNPTMNWMTKTLSLLARPPVLLLVVGILWYLTAYFLHPVLPDSGRPPSGWWGWFDQEHYRRSAEELSQLRLTTDRYFYPLGYPAMGALFIRWLPTHPFLIPNLLCFAGILTMFYRICRQFVSPWESFALAVATLVLPAKILTTSLVVPWNTIPVHSMLYAAILLLAFSPSRHAAFAIASLLAALIPWFRLGDLVYLPPLFAAHLWQDLRRGDWKPCAFKAVGCIGLFSLSIGAIAAVNLRVFGTTTSPYAQNEVWRFGLDGILLKTYAFFISSWSAWSIREPMLVHRFPFLLLTFAGVVALLRRDFTKHIGWIGTVVGCIGFYLAYGGFQPTHLFKFHLIHYWAWWIPLAALLAYVGVVKSWNTLKLRGVLLTTVPLILVAALIEPKAESVATTSVNAPCPKVDRIRLTLDTARAAPVSKLVVPDVELPFDDYPNATVTRNGRPMKWLAEYDLDCSGRGLVILFWRDVGVHDAIEVEFNRPSADNSPQFRLEAYRLRFTIGGRLFGVREALWFDKLSLPPCAL